MIKRSNRKPHRSQSDLTILLSIAILLCGLLAKVQGGEPSGISRAEADYLRALNLADAGSKPEALRFLAESIRAQSSGNPASALVFALLTELRTNSSLRLRGHTDGILDAAFSPDGSRIVTASEDQTARIWDARTGRQLLPGFVHEGEVRMAEFSPDGTRVLTASADGTARVWDAQTGTETAAL